MNNRALEEEGLLAALCAERGQENESCVGDDRTELDTKRDISQRDKETETRKHYEDNRQEERRAIKSDALVIPAYTGRKVLIGHGRQESITSEGRIVGVSSATRNFHPKLRFAGREGSRQPAMSEAELHGHEKSPARHVRAGLAAGHSFTSSTRRF